MVAKGTGIRSEERSHTRKAREIITRVISLYFLILASLFLSCAEVVAPPGGEEDTIGPSIIRSEPETGSVKVPLGNSVTIYFSERIIRPTTGTSVSISPRPAKPAKLKWGSEKVTVIFPDNFQPNRTYTVSLTSGVTDLRRKSVEGKSSISFSTGAAIDSGHLSGTVYRGIASTSKMAVGLFPATNKAEIVVDSVYPDYLLYTDKDGVFNFANVADGTYHLLAFEDRNRNELFDAEDEPFGLPDRSTVINGTNKLDSLILRMQNPSPDTLRIVDVSVTKNQLVHVRLNKAALSDSLRKNISTISLKPTDPLQSPRYAKSFLEQDSISTASLTFDFGPLPSGVCTLSVPLTTIDTLTTRTQITIEPIPDIERPRLLRGIPSGALVALPDSIALLFSEPVLIDSTRKAFTIVSDNQDTLAYHLKQLSTFSYKLSSDQIKLNRRYHITADTSAIMDRAGNHIADTSGKLEFRVLPEDSLGKISGSITNERFTDSLFTTVVTFLSTRGAGLFSTTGNHQFSIDLPAGKYLVSAFVDRDLDGRPGLGTLRPFIPAEQYIARTDTVVVRPRFETAGIELKFK